MPSSPDVLDCIPNWKFRSVSCINKIGEDREDIRVCSCRLEEMYARLGRFPGRWLSLDDDFAPCNRFNDPAYLKLQEAEKKKRVYELQWEFRNMANISSSFWLSFYLECTINEGSIPEEENKNKNPSLASSTTSGSQNTIPFSVSSLIFHFCSSSDSYATSLSSLSFFLSPVIWCLIKISIQVPVLFPLAVWHRPCNLCTVFFHKIPCCRRYE